MFSVQELRALVVSGRFEQLLIGSGTQTWSRFAPKKQCLWFFSQHGMPAASGFRDQSGSGRALAVRDQSLWQGGECNSSGGSMAAQRLLELAVPQKGGLPVDLVDVRIGKESTGCLPV